jgi:hypothetical protein
MAKVGEGGNPSFNSEQTFPGSILKSSPGPESGRTPHPFFFFALGLGNRVLLGFLKAFRLFVLDHTPGNSTY